MLLLNTLQYHRITVLYILMSNKHKILILVFVLVKLLCGLEASQVPVTEEALSSVVEDHLDCDSSDQVDADGHSNELKVSRKKKSKRQQGGTCL